MRIKRGEIAEARGRLTPEQQATYDENLALAIRLADLAWGESTELSLSDAIQGLYRTITEHAPARSSFRCFLARNIKHCVFESKSCEQLSGRAIQSGQKELVFQDNIPDESWLDGCAETIASESLKHGTTDRDRWILVLRLYSFSLREISVLVGISHEEVRRVLKKHACDSSAEKSGI